MKRSKDMIMNKILVLVLSVLVLVSCQKEIFIDLNTSDPKIVIEGEVMDMPGPYLVRLSRTVNFSEPNEFPPISDAIVIISDDAGYSEQLFEFQNGIYMTHDIQGFAGRTYSLSVTIEGETFTAQSTMPARVPLDGVEVINSFYSSSQDPANNYLVTPLYLDPPGIGNNYRIVQLVNGRICDSWTVQNDNLSDGLVNKRPIFGRDIELKPGDMLTVVLQSIEKPVYDYFYSLTESSGSGGGATPANPVSNITGGALGYFSAHSMDSKTVTIPGQGQ
jgi:hypothetical protein